VNGDGYDDVIVGAIGHDAPELNEGAAFVFLGSPFATPPPVPSLSRAGAALLGGLLLCLARIGFARRGGVSR
jgi:hypothetical protein